MVSGETFAVVFAGAEATRGLQARLREDIRDAGGRTAWITQDIDPGSWNLPPTSASVSPILEILPVQMMTLAMAANANVEAGRFARIPKITTTE
jgi:glucosamine--fructose-6-phosphate aminotransferase (isomerizing)